MRHEFGMTLVLTTHYLEEADRMAERVVIIDQGSIIADDTPTALWHTHAADVVTLDYADGEGAARARTALGQDGRFADRVTSESVGGSKGAQVRLEVDDGPALLPRCSMRWRPAVPVPCEQSSRKPPWTMCSST